MSLEISALDLCWWAEAVDGLQGLDDVYLVQDGNRVAIRRGPHSGSEPVIAKVPKTRDGKKTPKRAIACTVEKAAVNLPEIDGVKCDALFVTQSAAAKFVYPYYEAHRLLTDEEMTALKNSFNEMDESFVGIAHYPPSRPYLINENGDATPVSGHYLETAFVVKVNPKGNAAQTAGSPKKGCAYQLIPLTSFAAAAAEAQSAKGQRPK